MPSLSFGSFSKKKIILILLLLILIPVLIGLIFYFDSSGKPDKSDLADYYVLQEKINDLTAGKSSGTQTAGYTKLIESFKALEKNDLDEEERKQIMSNMNTGLMSAYIETHDHKLYELQLDLYSFIAANSPGVELKDFTPLCFDPACAPPQAEEIKKVIEEIKNSTLPDHIKESDIANLTNFSYLSDDTAESKAGDFLAVASMIRINPEYVKLGINEKIAAEIEAYVEKNFPKQYDSYISTIEKLKAKNE